MTQATNQLPARTSQAQLTFQPQLRARAKAKANAEVAVAVAVIAAVAETVAVAVAIKSATPNGRNAWCKSAASPRPSRAVRR